MAVTGTSCPACRSARNTASRWVGVAAQKGVRVPRSGLTHPAALAAGGTASSFGFVSLSANCPPPATPPGLSPSRTTHPSPPSCLSPPSSSWRLSLWVKHGPPGSSFQTSPTPPHPPAQGSSQGPSVLPLTETDLVLAGPEQGEGAKGGEGRLVPQQDSPPPHTL